MRGRASGSPVRVPCDGVVPAAIDVHEVPVQEPVPPMLKVVAEVTSPRLLPWASSLRRCRPD